MVDEQQDSQVQDVGGESAALPEAGSSAAEPRWSGFRAFMLAPFYPATAARRTDHITLGRMWVIHIEAVLLTAVVILLLVICEEASTYQWGAVRFRLWVSLTDLAAELDASSGWVVLSALGIVLAVELGFLVLALFAMPWGARDEPLGQCYREALRRTWLRTPHAMLAVAIAGVAIIVLDRVWEAFWSGSFFDARPWYMMLVLVGQVHTCFAMVAWFTWGLLRSVGAHRVIVPTARSPGCEACGYNLTTIPLDSRCPECGEPVVSSLGPESRCGPIWERRRNVGTLLAWRKVSMQTMTNAAALGRQLRAGAEQRDYGVFVAMHLPILFIIGALCVPAIAFVERGGNSGLDVVGLLFGPMPITATAATLGAVGFMLLVATTVGLLHSFREKRNLLSGSMQMAAYLTPYLVLWLLFGLLCAMMVQVLEDAMYFAVLEEWTSVDSDTFALTLWLLPNLVWLVGYFVLVSRGTQATRYANR